jgi:hypothetical protein
MVNHIGVVVLAQLRKELPPEYPPIRGVDEVWEFEFHLFRVWVNAGKQLNRLVTCEHLSVSFWEAIDTDT